MKFETMYILYYSGILVLMLLLISGCTPTAATGDIKPTTEVSKIGSSNTIDTEQVSTQSTRAGNSLDAKEIKELNSDIITNTGISPIWFIIGALLFGVIIPQPKFIKAIF